MSQQKLSIASPRNFEPMSVQTEELIQEIATRMIEENIKKDLEKIWHQDE